MSTDDPASAARLLRRLRGQAPSPAGRLGQWLRARSDGIKVFVGTECWTLSGVNIFCANLVRGLQNRGVQARVLMTEHDTELVQQWAPRMPLPPDLPVSLLPVSPQDDWGAHWGATLRFLEQNAPCIYVPNSDWRHSCVTPLLSDRVGVVGIVHSDDPLHYDHVRRLGRHWNSIVCVSRAVAAKTTALDPSLAQRVVTIPIGVSVAAALPPRPLEPSRPLELVYHGLLNQHQKRILDMPKIMDALVRRAIPARLTLIGSGLEREQLERDSRQLVEQGVVRFLGVLPPENTLAMLEQSDVFLMTSEFEGMPNALLEAMGRGCVPVVSDIRSGIPEVVRDDENGYLVPVGDIEAFAERVARLQRDPGRRQRMRAAAHRTVGAGVFNVEGMVREYEGLFECVLAEARNGRYRRPAGTLSHPPADVGGISLFPVACNHVVEGLGGFPSAVEARSFARQVHQLESSERASLSGALTSLRSRRRAAAVARTRDFHVVVGLPYWVLTGVSVFCEGLVRGLLAEGISAEILLTEQDTHLINIPDALLPLPEGIPVERLPVDRMDGWGAHWGTTIRYLEQHAPCVYLPNYDWRHSCVTPLLSKSVAVVGVLHSDDPLHYDHVARLGRHWDGVVAVSQRIAAKTVELYPECADRLVSIPYGVAIPRELPLRAPSADAPLRVTYHGVLNQHQKRILDLPQILRALESKGGSAVLSIAGAGPEEARLREECREFVERGAVRFLGVIPNRQALELLEQSDVYIMTSQYEGLPNALLEAMGRGCVPVVSAIASGIPELVRDGINGYLVDIGDVSGFADRLALLQREPELRRRLSRNAHRTVSSSAPRMQDMVQQYLELFQRVVHAARNGEYRRPAGPLAHAPFQVGNIGLFPVDCPVAVAEGRFPSDSDVNAFRRQIRQLQDSRVPQPLRRPIRFARRLSERYQARLPARRARTAQAEPRLRTSRGGWVLAEREGPVVCVATSTRSASAESSFIQAHMARLPARVTVLSGLEYPPLSEDGRPVAPSPAARVWRATRGRLLKRAAASAQDVAIARHLRSNGVRVVLAEYGPTGARLVKACRLAGLPLVVHFHGYDASVTRVVEHHGRYAELFAGAAAVIAVSHDMMRRLSALGAPSERLFYSCYGVDTALFTGADPEHAPPRFTSVGRFVEKKAPELTLLAFAAVRRQIPEATLTLIGDGPLLGPCQRLARALELDGAVCFAGHKTAPAIVASLATSRAFVLHSATARDGDSEGTPVAILEAAAAGLPVIATRHGGISEVVLNGTTGLLVDEGDVNGMTEHMLRLARDAPLAARMGQAGRQRVEQDFRIEQSIARLWGILRAVMAP